MLQLWTYLQSHMVRDEDGATMVEYGIMVALIAVVSIIAIGAIGGRLNGAFETVRDALPGGGP